MLKKLTNEKVVLKVLEDEKKISRNRIQLEIHGFIINHYGTDIELYDSDGKKMIVMNYDGFEYVLKKTFEFGALDHKESLIERLKRYFEERLK